MVHFQCTKDVLCSKNTKNQTIGKIRHHACNDGRVHSAPLKGEGYQVWHERKTFSIKDFDVISWHKTTQDEVKSCKYCRAAETIRWQDYA